MIINKDCLEALKELPDNSIDSIVTDPPYGLSFMGKKWDYDVPNTEIWSECLRVLKPGGYLLAFAGTRTQHRMAVRIEDAGFEIRDMIAWVYGSGFPKSLNIGKAVDKLQGNEREVVGDNIRLGDKKAYPKNISEAMDYQMGTDMGKLTKGTSEWEGWGTALKPALEPITVARKPIEGTVAENCLKYGVGGINIDGSRVGTTGARNNGSSMKSDIYGEYKPTEKQDYNIGRFPANLIHDGSEEVLELFPETKSGGGNKNSVNNQDNSFLGTGFGGTGTKTDWKVDTGSAARFFYCAKASKSERNMGLDGFEEKEPENSTNMINSKWIIDSRHPNGGYNQSPTPPMKNFHPTVKPIKLMEYLINLVSKEGHTVLDPFVGSGTTGIACKKLNRNFIGIERDEEYCKIAEARINAI